MIKRLFLASVMIFILTNTEAKPPQQAFDACKGSSVASHCSFETSRGTKSGVCRQPPNKTTLVCVPKHRDKSGATHDHPHKKPPQQAFDACKGSSVASHCSFETSRGTKSGVCRQPPNKTTLVCVPKHRDRKSGATHDHPHKPKSETSASE